MNNLQATFLFHSGVMVETASAQLFFDVFFDESVTPEAFKALLSPEKQVLFFVSHGHHDHFDSRIFEVATMLQPDKRVFILSDDVSWDACMAGNDVRFVKSGERYCIAGIKMNEINIKTFDSTDLGVAFHVEVDGNRIFHSGDLNWWHWKSMSPEILHEEARAYKAVIEEVACEKIDLAFIPLDLRLEHAAAFAFHHFLEISNAKRVVPIHFGDQFDNLKKICDENGLTHDQRVVVPTGQLEKLI